jgi:hypothetical protein
MLRAIIIITSLLLPIVVSSAAANAAPEPLHRGTKEHSGWHSIGPAPPTILATVAADPKLHTIYISSLGGGVISAATRCSKASTEAPLSAPEASACQAPRRQTRAFCRWILNVPMYCISGQKQVSYSRARMQQKPGSRSISVLATLITTYPSRVS